MDIEEQTHDDVKSKRKKKKAEKRGASESRQDRRNDDEAPVPSTSRSHSSSPFTSLKELRKQKLSDSSEDVSSLHKKKKRKKNKDRTPDDVIPELAFGLEKAAAVAEECNADDDSRGSKVSDSNANHKKKKKKKKNKLNKETNEDNSEKQNEIMENVLSDVEEAKESKHKSKHKKKKKKKSKQESNENDLSVNGITLDMLDCINADSVSELADKIANEANSNNRSSTPNVYSFLNENRSSDVDEPLPVSKVPSKTQSKPTASTRKSKKPTGKRKPISVTTPSRSKDASGSLKNTSAFNIEDESFENNSQSRLIGMDDPEVQQWLSSLEHDMVEEKLDYEPPPLHMKVPILRGASAKEKEELKNDGVYVRLGKWSPKEDLIIKENLERITKKYNVPASHLLLGINKQSREKVDGKLLRYLQLKKFSFQLAKNLPDRTLFSTYLRARKVFHPMIKGKLNKEQKSEMFRLKQKVGHKWNDISEIMSLPAAVLREAARYHMEKRDTGQWTTEENEKLTEAVKNVLSQREPGSYKKMPWKKISHKVGTRNKGQCCKQWLHNLCWKFAHGDKVKPKWTDHDSYRLVEHLHALDAEAEADLDWDAICSQFSKSDSLSTKEASSQVK